MEQTALELLQFNNGFPDQEQDPANGKDVIKEQMCYLDRNDAPFCSIIIGLKV